jgi:DnaJ domain
MFERNRIDRLHETEKSSTTVEVTLEDGDIVTGRLFHASSKPLGDELNNAGNFLDFEAYDGDRFFLAKGAVQLVRPRAIPKADQLARAQTKSELFNPWTVLGVTEQSSKDDIREAYHRLVKQYHPDRFANADLPAEVKDYLNAMARRVNAAYTTLAGGLKRDAAPTAAPAS